MDFRAEQKAVDLCGAWRMAYEHESDNKLRQATTGREIEAAGVPVWSARVPGNFELDLLENGLIEETNLRIQIHRFCKELLRCP